MRPPLAHVAARFDQDAVLDWLCEEMSQEKYSIDSADNHSNTSVHEAAAHGHLKCLQVQNTFNIIVYTFIIPTFILFKMIPRLI